MSRIQYEEWNPGSDALSVIRQANTICATYRAQGYDLTLRQLYYQFVSRALIPNNERSYKRLGSIVNKARLAGMLDWDYIVDRTRNLTRQPDWDSPAEIVAAVARQFRLDHWKDQPTRMEIWVEKEALAGVVARASQAWGVPYFSCRGYVSQSELWEAGQRLGRYIEDGQNVIVLHLGDHDPSGIDMTRDMTSRLETFIYTDFARDNDLVPDEWEEDIAAGKYAISDAMSERCDGREPLEFRRIALNMDQVQTYNPPPNPAKITDSRATDYIARFGRESWELDALEPQVLNDLIASHIEPEIDQDAWDVMIAAEARHKELLGAASQRWNDVAAFLAEAS